ncbi:MAG: hypothetical protein SOX72_09410 [Oscillospiraceae bacterium]|nr:hypothetical protein [Oscillospiraceae bacterium]
MQKGMNAMAAGVAVAMAAGTAAYMLVENRKKIPVKKMKKNAGKAVRAVGSLVDNFSCMVR